MSGSGGGPSTDGGLANRDVDTGGATGNGTSNIGGGAIGTGGGGETATAAFTCPAGPFAAPTFMGLVPERIADVPPNDSFNNNRKAGDIVEGPVWIDGALYLSEINLTANITPPASRILKVDSAGVVSIVLTPDMSGINGLSLDTAGNLVAGNYRLGSIMRYTLPGLAATQIVSSYNGVRFDGPNDLTFRADGNLYFTDPDWQAPRPRPQAKTRIYRVAPGSTAATIIDEGRNEPNGITLSPDGNTMYVTGVDGLFRYTVAASGTVGAGTKIVPSIVSGDGMAIDCAGNLYVAANDLNTLVVVDPAGNVLGAIIINVTDAQGIDDLQVTNAAFGGADHKTLYITTRGTSTRSGLFRLSMNIPGYPY